MSADLTKRWLTVDQAADIAGRAPSTIKRWLREGRLRGIDLDGHTWVNELELLHVERATRRAARAGRPGARPPVARLTDTMQCPQG